LVLQFVPPSADPEYEASKPLFVAAFNATARGEDLWIWEDPNDFDDEGDALSVLMIYVCRREFFPKIEREIGSKIPNLWARWRAMSAAYRLMGKMVYNLCQAGWSACRGAFNKAKEMINDKWKEVEAPILEVVNKIVSALLAKILEKLPKQPAPKEEEKKAPEAEKGWPGLQKALFSAELVAAVKGTEQSTPALQKLLEGFKGEFVVKRKLTRSCRELLRDVPPELDWMTWTIRRLLDAVEGTLDLFHIQMQRLMEYSVPFFQARDKLEAALAKVAGDGSKSADACKVEAKKEIDTISEELHKTLRETGVTAGNKLYWDRSELRWMLRELPNKASTLLCDLTHVLPERELNVLAATRLLWLRNADKAFDASTKADAVKQATRDIFLEHASKVFDGFFGVAWEMLTTNITEAAKITAVDKLYELVKPVIKVALDALASIIPDSINKIVDLPNMADMVTTKALEAGAAKAVAHFQAKMEASLFAQEPALSDEEKAAVAKEAEEKKKKAEEDKKKKEEEEAKYKPKEEKKA